MSKVIKLALVASVGAGLLMQSAAQAASPSAGNLSKKSRAITWTGGPFTLSSTFPAETGVDCLRGASDSICDHFALTINLGDRADIAVAITTPNACTAACLAAPVEGEDYDLYIYAPDGSRVAEKTTPGGNEKLVFKHRKRYNGKPYEVRVVPWAVRPGSSYKGTAQAISLGG